MRYRHTPDMGEISGFGGGYEQCCQDMLEAGVNWLIAHPDCELVMRAYDGVFGVLGAESPDAKAMEAAVIAAAVDPKTGRDEATGAQHHAVMQRLYVIRYSSWDTYCVEMRTIHGARQ